MKGSSTDERPAAYRKDLQAALRYFLKEAVPSLNGDLICTPVVNEIIAMIDHYLPATERLRPGQVLWYGIDVNETSGYGKRIEDCAIVPVLVDLITDEDIKQYLDKVPKRQRQITTAVRIHHQAASQGSVFTYADTAAIMRLAPGTVGRYIREYEKQTGTIVPRRGNIHDMGPTLTHKRIICIKHLMEGKSIEQTARETDHSPEAITRYTNDFKRVHVCLKEGWDLKKIAQATGLSTALAKQYVDMIENEEHILDTNETLPF